MKYWNRILRIIKSIPFFFTSVIKYFSNKNKFYGRKNLAISLVNPSYKQFYIPIINQLLDNPHYNIICFGNQLYNLDTYSEFTQIIISEPLIILAADLDFSIKKKRHRRIQMFHGISSFGSIWDERFLKRYDTIFVLGSFMFKQLTTEKRFSDIVKEQNITLYKVGYPKLDLFNNLDNGNAITVLKKTIFYGPTWHIKFSSIFKWLDIIFEIAEKENFKLIIKLHTYLYKKNDKICSGGYDWPRIIKKKGRDSGIDLTLLGLDSTINELRSSFQVTDIFITDVSGLGYEFVLATGKPIIFLDDKIKIPLGARRQEYLNYAEIRIRNKIGPIVYSKHELVKWINIINTDNTYKEEQKKIRQDLVYNLGKSRFAAIDSLNNEFDKILK